MFDWLLAIAMASARPSVAPALVQPAVPQNHLPKAQDVKMKVPTSKDPLRIGVATDAAAVVLMDRQTGTVLFGKQSDSPRSIASLTKMMTALVVLDSRPNFDELVTVQPTDLRSGAYDFIFSGDTVKVRDLLNLSLVASSNSAAATLARSTGLTAEEFAARMNAKAKEIGMANAMFVEPTGLDGRNKASAYDVALLLRAAFREQIVREAAVKSEYRLTTEQGKMRVARATDELLGAVSAKQPFRLLGGKTGFLNEAGYCFGAIAENGNGDGLVAVALGAGSKDERFTEVKKLLYWGFDVFKWPGDEVAVR